MCETIRFPQSFISGEYAAVSLVLDNGAVIYQCIKQLMINVCFSIIVSFIYFLGVFITHLQLDGFVRNGFERSAKC